MNETRQQTITERETPHGYWWRYKHADDEPQDTLLAATAISCHVAGEEARRRGKTYCVARAASGHDAAYVFACDHPDARNAAINIMYDCPPTGAPVRRRAVQRRH